MAGRPKRRAQLAAEAAERGEALPVPEGHRPVSPPLKPAGDPESDEKRQRSVVTRKELARIRREHRLGLQLATETGYQQAVGELIPRFAEVQDRVADIADTVSQIAEEAADARDMDTLTSAIGALKPLLAEINKGIDRKFGTATSRQQNDTRILKATVDMTEVLRRPGAHTSGDLNTHTEIEVEGEVVRGD